MKDILYELGLSDKEAALYLLLLEEPNQTAQQLANRSRIKRTNVYRLLDSLTEQGLIAHADTPIRRFHITDPHTLQKVLKDKQQQLKQTASSLTSMMPAFRSQYSLSLGKPGVVHMAGDDGFEKLLLDMLRSKTEVLLVASDNQPISAETLDRFQKLLLERKAHGVTTRALFHHCDYEEEIVKKFTDRGFMVRFTGTTPFTGEVVMYEDNTAFTVYKPSLITTIITQADIARTMRSLFETIWDSADIS